MLDFDFFGDSLRQNPLCSVSNKTLFKELFVVPSPITLQSKPEPFSKQTGQINVKTNVMDRFLESGQCKFEWSVKAMHLYCVVYTMSIYTKNKNKF